MTPAEFRVIRRGLGLSVRGLSDLLGEDFDMVRRWETAIRYRRWRPIPGAVQRLMVALGDIWIDLDEMDEIQSDPRIEKKKED